MKLVQGMLLASMLMAGGAGAAGKVMDAANAGSGMSGNDEWACKVAMCMANPGGPTEFAECVDPIRRLHRHLAKGKPFPVCRFLGGGSGGDRQGGDNGSRSTAGTQKERDPAQAL